MAVWQTLHRSAPIEAINMVSWGQAWWELNVRQRANTIWVSSLLGVDASSLASYPVLLGAIAGAGAVVKKVAIKV